MVSVPMLFSIRVCIMSNLLGLVNTNPQECLAHFINEGCACFPRRSSSAETATELSSHRYLRAAWPVAGQILELQTEFKTSINF